MVDDVLKFILLSCSTALALFVEFLRFFFLWPFFSWWKVQGRRRGRAFAGFVTRKSRAQGRRWDRIESSGCLLVISSSR